MAQEPPPGGSFAELFEQQAKTPRKKTSVQVGQRLDATVVQVTRDAVFVDLDEKRQAWIEAAELRGPDGALQVKVGDRVQAHVLEIDGRTGNVRLGRTLGKVGDLASLELARDQGIAVEGKVTAVNKGGVEVDVHGVRAFCPFSQLDLRFVQDTAPYLEKSFLFRVLELREKTVVLSRRAHLEAEAREAQEALLKTLQPGTVTRGTVSGVRDFGVFLDLGGVEGLIPASELAHDSSTRPGDVCKSGDLLEVRVKDLRREEGGVKITLSLKALAPDPWEALDLVAPLGKVLPGTVARVVDFGAFVRLPGGVEGLLHASELGPRGKGPALAPGDGLLVVVKSADAAARKIGLMLAPEDAVAGAQAQALSLAVGQRVQARVEKIELYGVFVQVTGTRGRAGRGLIPNAELGLPRGADVRKLLPEGTEVTAKVLETGEGRLRLSVRGAREDEERAQYEGYQTSSGARKPSLGTLGDLLKARKK
ncbi:MAG: S1 RNA-binding domain-containing protein [Deltaproteobacteria bacterium]|nr:S1 RNA-binding domain-containing protein [Deltaproteobacteria bacterium]